MFATVVLGARGKDDSSAAAPAFARPKPNFASRAETTAPDGQGMPSRDAGAASVPEAPAYDDDVVPYSDADIASYIEDDAYASYPAPWEGEAAEPAAATAMSAPAAKSAPRREKAPKHAFFGVLLAAFLGGIIGGAIVTIIAVLVQKLAF